MNSVREILAFIVLWTGAGISSASTPQPAGDGPVKVFILAGQSNMEGHGQIRSLDHLGDDPKYGYLLKLLKNPDGSWAVRDDVTISYKAEQRKEQKGPLTVGWGASANEIGPELMFGAIMGERYKEHVLLIKTAWGGKDVFCDFRSPGAGKPTGDEAALLEKQGSGGRSREVGVYYRKMISEIKECLTNIRNIVPGYHGQGYEIVGMAWFQGWNDFCQWPARVDERQVGLGIIEAYPRNLANMIRDLRKDLDAPDMPFVIGEMGVGGHEMTKRAENPRDREAVAMVKFRHAQKAVADDSSLKNVTLVPTLDFWDTRLEELRVMAEKYDRVKKEQKIQNTPDNVLPTRELSDEYRRLGGHWYCHYNGSAANYSLVGYALAQALDTNASLALTPPMGWNSWNAFEKDIDEGKIKEIADAMVASGMRDAGYTYLVLDDAWMAGNDLRTMSDQTRKVLTAPELIAVNQDRRGIQGYKVLNEEGREVYNKPLADGTTAVLLLNKRRERADITVRWDQIGLAGSQPVRDLWTRGDLGEFQDSFTARDLGEHEHKVIKVGRAGPPLPAPSPMPLEKYTVTRKGEIYLSDLYYIWKSGNAPAYDTAFGGQPIRIADRVVNKGIGAKGKSALMFQVNGRADRFRATVTMDDASPQDATGRFRVYNEDFFSNKVLWDSGQMTRDSPAKEIDVAAKDVQCLMLVFDGKNALGNWADARVINGSLSD